MVGGLVVLAVIRVYSILVTTDWQRPDSDQLRQEYLHSQYNLNRGYEFWGNMHDDRLYAYAALEYVRGTDPSELNFEHPPLGKYLLGWSYLATGRMMWVQVLAYLGLLAMSWLVAKEVGLKNEGAWLVVMLMSFDRLVSEHLQLLSLDFINDVLIMVALWGLLRWWDKKNKRLVMAIGLVIGGVMATRAVVSGLLLLGFVAVVVGWKDKERWLKNWALMFGGAIGVYGMSYVRVLMMKGVTGLVEVHIKIVRFYLSYLPDYPWGEIWRIFLLGRWRTWFAEPAIQKVAEYWLLWPVFFGLMLVSGWVAWKMRRRKQGHKLLLLSGWFWAYMLFNSTHVVFPKLLIAILPVVYVLGMDGLVQVGDVVKKEVRKRWFDR